MLVRSDTPLESDRWSIRASVSLFSRGVKGTNVFAGAGKGFTLTGDLTLASKNVEKPLTTPPSLGLPPVSGLGSGSEKGELNLKLGKEGSGSGSGSGGEKGDLSLFQGDLKPHLPRQA